MPTPLMRGTAGDGGCYTIPMGLCYGGGFWAGTLAPVLPLPGECFPLEGPGVMGQQESVTGPAGHSLLTSFPYKCGSRGRRPMVREGVREFVAVDAEAATDTISQRRVAMEVAGLAVWGAAQRRTKLTDEQVPLPLSAWMMAPTGKLGTIGQYW